MTKEEVFKPVSETNVVPCNGKVLVKLVIEDFPTMYINSGQIPAEFNGKSKTYIAGTSVDSFSIGEQVLVEKHAGEDVSNKVFDETNDLSFTAQTASFKEMAKGMTNDELQQLITKDKPRLKIVEYILVAHHDIRAKVITTK